MEVDGSDDFRFQSGDFQVAEPFVCAGVYHSTRGPFPPLTANLRVPPNATL